MKKLTKFINREMSAGVGTDLVGRFFVRMMDALAGPMFTDGLEKLKRQIERGA